jgi:hypothetical protein
MAKTEEVQRKVVKLGIDFRPIPVDLGDGTVWAFVSDPSPEQWSGLVGSLGTFVDLIGADGSGLSGDGFEKALEGLTEAMSGLLVKMEDRLAWKERGYGLGPQQAIAEALMEEWTGFPGQQPSPSGKGSKRTG